MGDPPRARSPIANEVFAPTADEVAAAEAVIDDYRASEADGVGAIGRDGQLVDAAHMRLAENVLARARSAGVAPVASRDPGFGARDSRRRGTGIA